MPIERVLLCAECGKLLDKIALVELLTTYEVEDETNELFEQVWHKDCYLEYAQRQKIKGDKGA